MKRKFRISFVLLLGILLLGAGLIGLTTVPDLMQYAFLPSAEQGSSLPEADDADMPSAGRSAAEADLLEQYDHVMETMSAAFPRLTVHGVIPDVTLTNEGRYQSVFVYAVGPSWDAVYAPRIVKGRPILRLDMENKSGVIVLDEGTAFTLFGIEDPLGKTVEMNGEYLEVVGVAAHGRKIGEPQQNAVWIPLRRYEDCSMAVVSAPADSAEYYTMFESQAGDFFSREGTMISMTREKTAAMLPLLAVFVILAIWVMKRVFSRIGEYGKIQIAKVRAESRRRYALQLIPYAIGHLVLPALLIVLAVAACYGVAVLAIGPLKTFPDSIPDTLGEYTSWVEKFWYLTGQAAKPVTLKTPELAQVQLWGGMILWGTLLILLRAAKNTLTGSGKRKEE